MRQKWCTTERTDHVLLILITEPTKTHTCRVPTRHQCFDVQAEHTNDWKRVLKTHTLWLWPLLATWLWESDLTCDCVTGLYLSQTAVKVSEPSCGPRSACVVHASASQGTRCWTTFRLCTHVPMPCNTLNSGSVIGCVLWAKFLNLPSLGFPSYK